MTLHIDPSLPKVKFGEINKGCVLHMPLDQQSYNPTTKRFTDMTPFCNHGISANAANFTTDMMGQSNRATSLVEADFDYINCGNDDSLDVTGAITISVWVNPDNIDTHKAIIGNGATSWQDGYVLYLRPTADEMVRMVTNTGTHAKHATIGNVVVNEWTHIVGSWDGTSIFIYINGVKYSPTLTTSIRAINAGDTKIGANVGGLGDFTGSTAEARLYNIAVSEKVRNALTEQYRPKFLI